MIKALNYLNKICMGMFFIKSDMVLIAHISEYNNHLYPSILYIRTIYNTNRNCLSSHSKESSKKQKIKNIYNNVFGRFFKIFQVEEPSIACGCRVFSLTKSHFFTDKFIRFSEIAIGAARCLN